MRHKLVITKTWYTVGYVQEREPIIGIPRLFYKRLDLGGKIEYKSHRVRRINCVIYNNKKKEINLNNTK